MSKRKALLIGVGKYDHLPPLKAPAKNLKGMKAMLEQEDLGGFFLFKDRFFMDLTASQIKKAIASFFKEANREDLLLLYYTGHGLLDFEDPTNLYLTGTDSSNTEPDIDSVSKDFIVKRINQTPASQLIVIIDCCYSGRFTKSLKFNRSEQTIDIITSTDSNKYSFEPTDLTDPAFTYFTDALIKGIEQGEAGSNNLENIYTGDIFSYIKKELKGKKVPQSPQGYSSAQMKSLFIAKNLWLHKIPHSILEMMGNEDPFRRISTIDYLAKHYYETKNEAFAKKLHQSLTKLANDVNKSVAEAAQSALNKSGVIPGNKDTILAPPIHTIAIAYLEWLINLHSYLRLHGIKAAKDFKGVRLENVYVALRGDKASSYERMKAKESVRTYIIDHFGEEIYNELDEDSQYELELDFIMEDPIMPSIAQRDKMQSDFEIPITLGEAFRDERFLVILGDPGSGKSTLAKWLVIKLADAFLKQISSGQPERVKVPENQIDPFLEQSTLYDLGPARFPILVSISDYSQCFEERKVPLIDYLGEQKWENYQPRYSTDEDIEEEHLKHTIIHYLKKGEAVIILDGLDEVTKNRKEVVTQVEDFINKWIILKGEKPDTPWDELDWQDYNTPPGVNGGNQVVITSRIVGYHLARINNSITHVVIEPMRRQAISRFCEIWMEMAHLADAKEGEALSAIRLMAKKEAEELKQAIFADKRILELASNPLIITILALVYRNNNGVLPAQRAALYQEAMHTLVESWKKTDLSLLEVEHVLSAVASTIHMHYSKGLIKGAELREIIWKNLAEYRHKGLDPKDIPPSFEETVEDFITEINNKVGIIAPRGHESYSFLHLTFQEYLAARFITRDKQQAAEFIIQYMDNPRWKVPLLMGLGHISVDPSWGPGAVGNLIARVLQGGSLMGGLFPRTALFLAEGFSEMSLEKIEEPILEKVALQLLQFYSQGEQIEIYPQLKIQIERAIQSIRKSEKGAVIDELFCKIFSGKVPELRSLIGISAQIIYENRWFSKRIVRHLYKAIKYDKPEWSWIITTSLIKLASGQISFDKPKEPTPPDTPQSYYEKQVRAKLEELAELKKGTLIDRIEKEIEETTNRLPLLERKQRLHQESIKRKEYSEQIEYYYELMERVMNGTLKKEWQDFHRQLQDTVKDVKSPSSELPWRTFRLENVLAQVTKEIKLLESGYTIEYINEQIGIITERLNETNQKHQQLEEEIKEWVGKDAFNDLIQDILKSAEKRNNQSIGTENSSDPNLQFTPISEELSQEKGLSGSPINSSMRQHQEAEDKLRQLKERRERILNGTEQEVIQNEIDQIREQIRQKDFSYAGYRELRRRYDFTYRYYEEGVEKYDNQEVHPFQEYGLLRHLPKVPDALKDEKTINEQNFTKFLIVSALLGGYRHTNQVEVSHIYEDTATFLGKPDAERNSIVEQSPQSFYGRYGYDDPIYGAAVQLDTRMINIEDHVTVELKTSGLPEFSERFYYRKCSLSKTFLRKLFEAERTEEIRQQINLILEVSSNQEESIDSRIASIFLQTSSSDIINLIEDCDPGIKAQLLQQLGLIKQSFREPIFKVFNQLYLKKLDELGKNLDNYVWFEYYRSIFRSITKAYGRPIIKASFLGVAPSLSYTCLLANHWYTQTMIYMEDREEVIRNMLQQYSGEGTWPMGVRDALLQVSEAPLYEMRQELGHPKKWEVNTFINETIFREDEIPFDALVAIENFHLLEYLPNRINHLFKTTYLKELLGVQNKNQEQRWEVYLFCLQNKLFDNGLEEYLPSDIRDPDFISQKLLPNILKVRDRYYACRALLRYLHYTDDNKEMVILKLQKWAYRIKDTFERAQIVCRLDEILEKTDARHKNYQQIIASIGKLKKPFQKIKILVDHPQLIEDIAPEQFESWTIEGLKEILWPYNQAKVIRILLREENIPSRVKHRLIDFALHLDQSFMTDVALDLVSLDLLTDQENGFRENYHWAAILTYGVFDQLGNFFSSKGQVNAHIKSIDRLWRTLKEEPTVENVNELILRGVENGLRLNSEAVAVLDYFIQKDEAPLIYPLFPILDTPFTGAISTITTWMQSNDPQVKDYASLYLGEFNGVDSDNISSILRLANTGASKALFRANNLLSRGISRVKRFPLPYRLSDLDDRLLRQVLQYMIYEKHQPIKTYSRFLLFDTLADSISVIDRYLRGIYQGSPDKDLFLEAFDWIGFFSAEVEAHLANFIEKNGVDTAFLKSLIRIIIGAYNHHDENQKTIYYKLLGSLIRLAPDQLKQYTFFPGGAFNLIEVLTQQDPSQKVEPILLDQAADKILDNVLNVFSRPYEEVNDSFRKGLFPAAGYHYYKNYHFKTWGEVEQIQEAYTDQRFEWVIQWLFYLEDQPEVEENFLDIRKESLLVILALWSDERNISLLNAYNEDQQLYQLFMRSFSDRKVNSVGRLAMLNISRYFERHTTEGIQLYSEFLQIGPEYWQTVALIFKKIKHVDEDLVDFMIAHLDQPKTQIAYHYVQILSNYAKDENIQPKVRYRIILAFVEAVKDPQMKKGVYGYIGEGSLQSPYKPEYIGRLDQAIFDALLRVCGIV